MGDKQIITSADESVKPGSSLLNRNLGFHQSKFVAKLFKDGTQVNEI